jgi:DNA-binding NarL/FixJ family response regulator
MTRMIFEPQRGAGERHAGGRRLRVLVVAQDAPDRDVLVRRLSNREEVGRLDLAPDPAGAWLLNVAAADVAFVQVALGGVDGFGLARLLRCLAPPPSVVIVSDDPSRALEAFDVGAIDFVPMAASPDRLAVSLRRVPPLARTASAAGRSPAVGRLGRSLRAVVDGRELPVSDPNSPWVADQVAHGGMVGGDDVRW